MSEYVKKQALLEYLIPRTMRPIMSNIGNSPFYDGMVEATEIIIQKVKSGAFDAEPVQEVQRLRTAFSSRGVFNALRYYQKQGLCEGEEYDEIEKALEAISTTEPTDPSISKTQVENIKKLLNDPAYHGMYRSGIFDVLEELGITIPGINAPEGDGNDA